MKRRQLVLGAGTAGTMILNKLSHRLAKSDCDISVDKEGVLTTTVDKLRRAKGVRTVSGELIEDGEKTLVQVTTALPCTSLWVVAQTSDKVTAPLQKFLQAQAIPFEMRLTFVATPPAPTRELTRSIHGGPVRTRALARYGPRSTPPS